MSAAALTLATFNTARISKLETHIAHNNKRLDHLVDITTLHEQHLKAVDQKLDDVSSKLALLLSINKVHFAKMTDFMEQKFDTAVAISERLIRSAYSWTHLWKLSDTSMKSRQTATCYLSSTSHRIFFWSKRLTSTNLTRKPSSLFYTCHWSPHIT